MSKWISMRSPRNVSTAALETSARCQRRFSRPGSDDSRQPGRPTSAHCHGTPDFIAASACWTGCSEAQMAVMKPANVDRQWMAALIPGAVFAVRVKMRLRPADMPPVRGIRAPGWPTEKPETVAQAVPFDAGQARRPGPGPGGSQGSPSIGSLDDPEAARPVLQYSFEHTLSWFP